jgi:cysteine desulfuration protein SufE
MIPGLEKIARRFVAADKQTRLELLLDYSRKLPDLPERFHAARAAGLNVVTECQSPVYLYLEREKSGVSLHADAPREAPTVRGFVSLLARGIRDASPHEVSALPQDLIEQLGLGEALGMTRLQGLSAVVARVKRMAVELERGTGGQAPDPPAG